MCNFQESLDKQFTMNTSVLVRRRWLGQTHEPAASAVACRPGGILYLCIKWNHSHFNHAFPYRRRLPGDRPNTRLLYGFGLLCRDGRGQFAVDKAAQMVVLCWRDARHPARTCWHVPRTHGSTNVPGVRNRHAIVLLFTCRRPVYANPLPGCFERGTETSLSKIIRDDRGKSLTAKRRGNGLNALRPTGKNNERRSLYLCLRTWRNWRISRSGYIE